MDQLDDIHICHFAANATDFTNRLAFRFQVTEKTGARQEQATSYGLIGNNKIRIPREVASYPSVGSAGLFFLLSQRIRAVGLS